MTVYVDVLLTVNLFVNYALLLCSSMILKSSTARLRILLGAAVGSIYGLVIFVPEIPKAAELLLRLAASIAIVLCAFGYKNIRHFLRAFFTFFAVSFAFGGIMVVLWVTVAPTGMVYKNGAVYFNINLLVLAVSTVVCFTIVSLISHFAARRAPRNSVYKISVCFNKKEINGTALADTGNSLVETFSGYPVIIGEYKNIEKILPQCVKDYYASPTDIKASADMRLVISKNVSGIGILPAFRPDFIEVKSISKTIKTDEIYIAVTKENLANSEYSFILNTQIFEKEKYHVDTVEKIKSFN